MTAWRAPLAGVAAVAVVLVTAVATRPATDHAVARGGEVRPVSDVRLVCPGLDGSASAPVQLAVADVTRQLSGLPGAAPRVTAFALQEGAAHPSTPPVALVLDPAQTLTFRTRLPATVVAASGQGAAGVAAAQHVLVSDGAMRGLLSAPCLPARTDTWITGADGRVGHDDVLALGNPGSTDAEITVTAWSATGPVDLPGLQSYPLAAGHSVALDLAHYAPDAALLALHLHADVGRVAGQVRDHQSAGLAPAGSDWLPPTQPPARHLVVPGFLPAAGPRLLVVTNPGRDDATVRLRVYVRDRAFVPAGHPDLVVAPGRSALLDLSTSMGGAPGAVELSSDHPVVAAGESQVTRPGGFPEVAWHPAAPAMAGPVVLAASPPPLGSHPQLFLTAVGAAAQVRLVPASGPARTLRVEGDRTLTVDLARLLGAAAGGPVVVVPLSGQVWASRALDALGAHGPLVTSTVPVPVPAPIRLPPVRQDLRVAVR